MKSAILKNGKIVITEKEIPTLKNAEGAIIKVKACGLCGSDIVKINHATPENEDKISLGHEIVGEIVDINVKIKGMGAKEPFKKGDIIAMGHHYPCFKCKYCTHGNYSMCKTFKNSNIHPGGFSEYIYANSNHLKNTVFKKPENLTEEEFSFLEPLSCCIRAVKRSGLVFDNKELNKTYNALVLGLGSIGILMAQAIKAFGANTFGFDINEKRQEFIKNYGINFNENIKYDLIFMTSGANKAIDSAMKLIDKGGKIIVFSSIPDDFKGYFNNEIYYKELDVLGSYSPSPDDLKMSYEFLKLGFVNVKNISAKYSLENLENAINGTKQGKILKGYIELWKWKLSCFMPQKI